MAAGFPEASARHSASLRSAREQGESHMNYQVTAGLLNLTDPSLPYLSVFGWGFLVGAVAGVGFLMLWAIMDD
jgi:hypothetical protein